MAPGTTSTDEHLPREETLPSKEVEAPNLNQFQWPAFHLIEHPMGGTNATGGSLPAVRALRTSRMTCCRTPFVTFESSSLPRHRSFRAASKTKKPGVATAPQASAAFWGSSRRYGKLDPFPFDRSTMR